MADKYRGMSQDELISRLVALESSPASTSKQPIEVKESPVAARKSNGTKAPFDIRSYPCRKIALRFSYDGTPYNGLAIQSASATAASREEIVTVEEVLWKALQTARLIGEEDTMADVGWSRCGRTDRGVSAAGQVVALWVRSRRVDQWRERIELAEYVAQKRQEKSVSSDMESTSDMANQHLAASKDGRIAADETTEELSYVAMLNSILPATIRAQAWSPVQPHFSARFDCRYRHYKYFFTSGCSIDTPLTKQGPNPRLDISLMREAAQYYLGDHDFRNFCRVDATKQIDNFRRRIDGVSIDEVSRPWSASSSRDDPQHHLSKGSDDQTREKMYVLNLRGTAFLYHQVRHMVAILFAVGAGLEKSSIVNELLNVRSGAVARDRVLMRRRGLILNESMGTDYQTTLPDSTATGMTGNVASDAFKKDAEHAVPADEVNGGIDEGDMTADEVKLLNLFVYDTKPEYEMASDRPLMLWDCGFKEGDIQWGSGTYDGPLPTTITSGSVTSHIQADVNSSTAVTIAQLHSHWSSLTIQSEMYKHFLLALPLDRRDASQAGFIPPSQLFEDVRSPSLLKGLVEVSDESLQARKARALPSVALPLGDGIVRALHQYKPLSRAHREIPPEVKNANYLNGRGQRKLQKKG